MRFYKLLRLITSPQMVLLGLFFALLFGKGLFSLMSSPMEKLIILSTVVLLNVIAPTIIHRKVTNSRVLYTISMTFFFVLSSYIISSYIFYTIVAAIYTTALWVMALNLILKIDSRVMSLGALLSIVYIMIYNKAYAFSELFIALILFTGIYISVSLAADKLRFSTALIALLLGIASTLVSFYLF